VSGFFVKSYPSGWVHDMVVDEEDIRTDEPKSDWQLANENVALMAKVDELQEAVEEAVEIVEWTLHIFRDSGIDMADKCANWLKKHGGKG